MSDEPQRAEVLGWIARHGGSAIEAARHFFPNISPEAQEKRANTYRKWVQRERAAAPVVPGPRPVVVVAAPATLDEPRYDLADLPLMAQLRELLATAWVDLETARRARDHRGMGVHRSAIAELGGQLEALRLKAARAVKVEQTASAVAAELERKRSAIDLRAERERRRTARAAQAAAQTPKEREL